MRKFIEALVATVVQAVVYYGVVWYELTGYGDVMGLVIGLYLLPLVAGFIYAIVSKSALKYLFPVFTFVSMFPSIYSCFGGNMSFIVHLIGYAVVSIVGIFVGTLIKKVVLLIKRVLKDKKK